MHSHQNPPCAEIIKKMKQFLIKDNAFSSYQAEKLSTTNSVEEVWRFIFIYDLFESFYGLLQADIYPTVAELNLPTYGLPSVWHALALREGSKVFKFLLDKNILPPLQTLSIRDTFLKANVWHFLSITDRRVAVFQTLLGKNILPSAQALSTPDSLDNANTWDRLACSKAGVEIFQNLINRGILPTAEALSIADKLNVNTWWNLAYTDQGIAVFQALLDRGILPTAEALSIANKFNKNTWRKLTYTDQGIAVFQALLDRGILPTAQALSERDTYKLYPGYKPQSAWYGLSSKVHVLSQLIEHGIIPPVDAQQDFDPYHLPSSTLIKIMQGAHAFSAKYNIPHEGLVPVLLTREEVKNYYGFLYLFYRMTSKNKPSINLPLDLWLMIGRYILPASVSLKRSYELIKEKNRLAFTKYHCINALDGYLTVTFSSFFNKHNMRATSLRNAVSGGDNLRVTLINQYYMSGHPKLTFTKRPNKPHERSFKTKNNEESFAQVLKDGCFLSNFKSS